ncbi:MAG: hypothetical protein ACE5JG_01825 [Planctomycetota bacterium]
MHVSGHRVVAYPGLEVSFVAGTDRECYFHRGRYYCYHEGEWFYATRLPGQWRYIPMKYVPPDLFRVHGHRPPEVEGSGSE